MRVDDIVALVKRHDFEDLKRFPGVGIETGGVGGNDKLADRSRYLSRYSGVAERQLTAEHKFADCIEIQILQRKGREIAPAARPFRYPGVCRMAMARSPNDWMKSAGPVSASARPGAKRQEYGDQRNR